MNDGGGNGASCVGIKVRTDATKLSDMVIASKLHSVHGSLAQCTCACFVSSNVRCAPVLFGKGSSAVKQSSSNSSPSRYT